MNFRNLIFVLVIFSVTIIGFMCTGGTEMEEPEEGIFTATGYSRNSNMKEYGIPAEIFPIDIDVPDGMIEGEEAQMEMINAKIDQLNKINHAFWGPLPDDYDALPVLFQDIWSYINTYFPGFEGILKTEDNPDGIDWDKLGEDYYYTIEEGLRSYGEFAYMLTRMAFILEEGHSFILPGRLYGKSNPFAGEGGVRIWNAYLNNAPVLSTDNTSRIGACYTVTEEEKLTVTKVWDDSPNPYNLQIGDEIVGYNGVPWSKWIEHLFDTGIPTFGSPASSKPSIRYNLLRSGMGNVNLFEKINIKRYETGEIETMDVVYLDPSIEEMYQAGVLTSCTELPYDTPGIDWKAEKTGEDYNYTAYPEDYPTLVYGKLSNTNIGYIFLMAFPSGFDEFEDAALWDPYKTEFSKEFERAVQSLMDTDGLIIDLRRNVGGRNEVAYRGLSLLIDSDKETTVFVDARRDSQEVSKLALEKEKGGHYPIMPDEGNQHYDNPIIIMTGPDCISACDYAVAFFSKFEEFTIIGKDTNGSFTGVAPMEDYKVGKDFVFRYIAILTSYFVDNTEDILLRSTGFVDEYAWFEKEDIYQEVDSLRIKALNLIKEDNPDADIDTTE